MKRMIRITITLTGPAAELIGHEALEYKLVQPATVGELLELMYVKYPDLAARATCLQMAVNGKPADILTELAEGDLVTISV